MNAQWYFVANNERYGPLPAQALVEYLRDGRITRETLVWREGMTDWAPLAQMQTELVPPPAGAPAVEPTVEQHPEGFEAEDFSGGTSLDELNADLGGKDMRLDVLSEQGGGSFDVGQSIASKYPPVQGAGGGGRGAAYATEYAGFWRRFAAVFLDGILVAIITVPVMLVVGRDIDTSTMEGLQRFSDLSNVISTILSIVYGTVFEGSAMQGTPGKRVLGMAVTNTDGDRIGFGRALGRNLAKLLSGIILLIGYLIQPFTARRQALHDLLAGTLVLRVG